MGLSKKAAFDFTRKTIYWMIAGVVIVAVIMAYALILGNYSNRLTEVPTKFQSELILLRFLQTEDCFGVDGARGVIDLTKFTNAQVDFCYSPEKKRGHKDLNFQFFLPEYNLTVKTNNYFQKVDFTLFKTVIVKDGNSITPTQLIIYVQEEI
jgi:hypothetical protein